MPVGLIVGVIIFGFVILILTGLGVLTQAIFGIKEEKVLILSSAFDNIPAATLLLAPIPPLKHVPQPEPTSAPVPPPASAHVPPPALVPPPAPALATQNTTTKQIIDLYGSNLVVAKIALITIWILIIIGIFGAKVFI